MLKGTAREFVGQGMSATTVTTKEKSVGREGKICKTHNGSSRTWETRASLRVSPSQCCFLPCFELPTAQEDMRLPGRLTVVSLENFTVLLGCQPEDLNPN